MVQMFTSMYSVDIAKKIVKELGDLIYIVQHQEWRQTTAKKVFVSTGKEWMRRGWLKGTKFHL